MLSMFITTCGLGNYLIELYIEREICRLACSFSSKCKTLPFDFLNLEFQTSTGSSRNPVSCVHDILLGVCR
jgi:hypothetical protein